MNTKPTRDSVLVKATKLYPGVDLLYHVAYYRAARVGYQDIISRSLHDFKDGCEPQTARWITLAASLTCKELKFDVIVRALGSNEDTASGETSLDRLCETIARKSGAVYAPERLTKTRGVTALTTLGGRLARQKELEGAYAFDATGLPEKVRLLVVDDLATTGATLAAVSRTIRDAHPGAEVLCLTLARVEAQLQNLHLDTNYFLTGAVPSADVRSDSKRTPAKSLSATVHGAIPTARQHVTAVSRETSVAMLLSKPKPAPDPDAKPRMSPRVDVRAKNGGAVSMPSPRKGLDTRVYVVGLILSLMLLGATVLIPTRKEPEGPRPQFTQLVSENAVRSPEPIPERRSSVFAPVMGGKIAMVTVPSMGLRADHAMEAKILPNTKVRNKERVEVIRKFAPSIGPDWVQVRTQNGTIGWVVASVVKDVRG